MKTFSEANYQAEVLDDKENVVLVDVWAAWCSPCRQLAPLLDKISDIPGTKIGKLNFAENEEFCAGLEINALPTMLFYKGGVVVKRLVGLESEERLRAVFAELKGG